MIESRATAALLGIGLVLPAFSPIAAPNGWQTQGTNTLRLENYGVSGDPLASPYSFEGGQFSNELAISTQRRVSPFEFWRGQVSGVLNDSEYRSPFDGVVPEVLSLYREKGDGPVPYRMELGDYYGYYSYRTLQRGLKGVQFEFQPLAGRSSNQLSIVLSSGSAALDWRDLHLGDDYTNGISVLLESDWLGRVNTSLLHNSRSGDATQGTLDRDQWVFSVAGEHSFALAGQRILLEGEWGLLDGDHDGNIDPDSGQDRNGSGLYAQLSGQSHTGIHYRSRYERYGQDYRPAGAVITPDRRLFEGHLGWRSHSGLQVSGRYQNYRDQFDSPNPQDTDIIGVQFTGPLAPPAWYGLNGSIDAYRQKNEDRSGAFDVDSMNLNASLNAVFPDGTLGMLTLFAQDQDDRTAADTDSTTWETTLSLTRTLEIGDWYGSITPGVMLRRVNGGFGDTDDWQPTLAASLAKGAHTFSGNYGVMRQRPNLLGSANSTTQTAALSYSHTDGKDVIGLEANWYEQSLDPGNDTEAYRIGIYWTHYFGNADPLAWLPTSAISSDSGSSAPLVPVGDAGTYTRADIGLLAELAPGADMRAAEIHLAEFGLPAALVIGDYRVYETALLPNVLQRQRLVIESRDGRIKRSALIVALGHAGAADSDRQLLETIREALISANGRPANNITEGEVGGEIATAVNRGRFIDLSEWVVGENRIRLGIPRRLDGQVRIEIQHAHQFGPPRETRWSIEAVR